MNAVLAYLLNYLPWAAVIVIAVWATWRVSKYHLQLEIMTEKVGCLPCEQHKEDLRQAALRFDELQHTVNSTNDLVVEINKWIMKVDNNMIDKLARKASPLKMTPLGEILFQESFAKESMDKHMDYLLQELEQTDLPTAYDVENESLNLLLRNMSHEVFNPIKQYLYYSPEVIVLKDPESGEDKEVTISMLYIVKLMSIYLRDKYLEKHPGIE